MAFGAPKMGMGLGTATPMASPHVKPIARVPSVAGMGLHSAPKVGLPKVPHLAAGGSLASNNIPGIPTSQPMSEDPYHGGGIVEGNSGGRTDRVPLSVDADSFVMPAAELSVLGQGHNVAGAKIMDGILASGPFGTAAPKRGRRADGGNSSGAMSRVLVASGEYIIPRAKVEELGKRLRAGGKSKARSDLAAGHAYLHDFVLKIRAHEMKRLKNAPSPKK